MKIIRQPKGSSLCGQACVAMLLELSLDEAIARVGKRGKTSTADLVRALNGHFCCGTAASRVRGSSWDAVPYAPCLVRVTKEKLRHWVICREGKIFDPASGVFPIAKPPRWLVENDVRPKSFFFIGATHDR